MFRYTASKYNKRHLADIASQTYVRDREYRFVRSLIGGVEYSAFVAFWKNYESTNFVSPVRMQEIPVGGYYFPVELFDCEEFK